MSESTCFIMECLVKMTRWSIILRFSFSFRVNLVHESFSLLVSNQLYFLVTKTSGLLLSLGFLPGECARQISLITGLQVTGLGSTFLASSI